MRVRLKDKVDIPQSEQKRLSARFKNGKEYAVTEITGRWLRIHDEDSDGGHIWEAQYFDVTNAEIPPNWVIDLDDDGGIQLAPRRWLEPGFWEAFCDDDTPDLTWAQHTARVTEAHEIYEEEMNIILG